MRRGRTQCPRRRCGGGEPRSRSRCCAHAAGRCAVPLHLSPIPGHAADLSAVCDCCQWPVAAGEEPQAQCRCGGIEPQSHFTLGCAARGRVQSRCKQRHSSVWTHPAAPLVLSTGALPRTTVGTLGFLVAVHRRCGNTRNAVGVRLALLSCQWSPELELGSNAGLSAGFREEQRHRPPNLSKTGNAPMLAQACERLRVVSEYRAPGSRLEVIKVT